MCEAARIDTASRNIAAPPDAVFAAWTDPAKLSRWLPPDGATMDIERFQPVPGGELRLLLTFAEAADGQGKTGRNTDRVTGRFAAIEPDRRLALDIEFESDRPEFAGTMRMDWSFSPVGGGTGVRIECHNVPPGISAEAHTQGLESSLANLAAFMEQN